MLCGGALTFKWCSRRVVLVVCCQRITITNEKGRLSQSEIDRMVQEAGLFVRQRQLGGSKSCALSASD